MLTGNLDTKVPNDDSSEELCNNSDRKAAEIAAHETSRLSISYSLSEELHEFSQVFYDRRLPSKTLKYQDSWIHVSNPFDPRSAEDEDESLYALPYAWHGTRFASKVCPHYRK